MNFASAAFSRSDHEALSLNIQNSIEWTQHVIQEVNKGSQFDVKHANAELTHLKNWLGKMSQSYAQLSKQPLSETREAHFIAVKSHQNKAEDLVSALSIQFNSTKPNFKEMKKLAQNIKLELEAAGASHQQELKEIERP